MFVNIIKSYRDVVAICDKELIGKKFEEDKFQLDIKENFYKRKEVGKEEILELIRNMSVEDATFNIVGEKSVLCAIEADLISEEGVKKIQGVPFALVLM